MCLADFIHAGILTHWHQTEALIGTGNAMLTEMMKQYQEGTLKIVQRGKH